MKFILYTFFDLALIGILGLWLFLGIEGAGNVYSAFVWFIFAMCLLLLLAWSRLPEMKKTVRPVWRKRINTALSLVQIAALFWFGEMIIGSLLLFCCVILGAVEDKVNEVKTCAE